MTDAAQPPDRPSAAPAGGGTQRLDKWLWFARVARTRTLAASLVTGGSVRINRDRTIKPSHVVRVGDVITVTVGPRVRVLEVVAPGARRGPAVEAQTLFVDLTPPREATEDGGIGRSSAVAAREAGSGRPTKRDRRALDRFTGGSEDD